MVKLILSAMIISLVTNKTVNLILVSSLLFKSVGHTQPITADTDTETNSEIENVERESPPEGESGEDSTISFDGTTVRFTNRFTTRRPTSNVVDQITGIIRTSTTREPRSTTTRWASRPPPPVVNPGDDIKEYEPSVNFTISKVNTNVTTWNSTNTATINIRNFRQLGLTFTCNASYPVEWLCSTDYNASTWEIKEYRQFEEVQRANSGTRSTWLPSPFSPSSFPTIATIYTVVLTLTYEKNYVPPPMNLSCAPARRHRTGNVRLRSKTTLEISKDITNNMTNALTLHVKLKGPSIDYPFLQQFRPDLGKNEGCSISLHWSNSHQQFECISSSPGTRGLVIDYYEQCFDWASCERLYSTNNCPYDDTLVYSKSSKAPSELWAQDSLPFAGVVSCRREEDQATSEKTAALHFFLPLSAICPDDVVPVHTMYIHSELQLDSETLARDFVSFCLTLETNKDENQNKTRVDVYIGENIEVTCVASRYHFALGTRILIQEHYSRERYVKLIESMTMVDEGSFNFTAKVNINSDSVTGLFCENYLKQSDRAVRKYIPLTIKIPQNITFKHQTSQLAQLRYTGQADFYLECEVINGDPLPTIEWKKEGREISALLKVEPWQSTESAVGSRLLFPYLHLEDSLDQLKELQGTYTCEAQNKLDRLSRTYIVQSSSEEPVSQPISHSTASSSMWFLWILLPILGVIIVGVIGYLVWKIKVQSKELQKLTKAEVDEFRFGRPEFLQHHSSSEEVNNYAPYLPYNKNYEIGMDQLEIDENSVLGSGAYAIVLRGLVTQNNGEKVRVAIKTARSMDDISFFKALLSELKIMGFIGTHPNIVNLVGANTRNIQIREVYIAIEYCENGNLLTYLRDHRNQFTNLVTLNRKGEYDFLQSGLNSVSRASFIRPEQELSTVTLVKWAYEIANGMEFLSKKKVIHGDLAARNILMNENLIAKIGDFGLSRQLFEYVNYIKKQQSPLPWKWLAIECLRDMRFSVPSDVWAYGIMLYEIFSLGQVPYPGHSYNDEFLEALEGGKRPTRPNHATTNVYKFMESCWLEKSDDRPNFSQVREFFNKLLYKLVPEEYIELHERVTTVAINPTVQGSDRSENGESSHNSTCSHALASATGSTRDNENRSRFSFNINTKTLSAVFRRN